MIRCNNEFWNYVCQLRAKDKDGKITEQNVASGGFVIQQNKRIFSVFIVKSGVAKCFRTEDNGIDFIQEFFGHGSMFGELEALLPDLSIGSIQAISDLELLKLDARWFNHLIENDKKFNRLIMKSFVTKIRDKADRHAFNQSHTAKENLDRLVVQFPSVIDDISKRDIANYLGITERNLNRILKDLEVQKA